jgi:uncharacterized RDD family membrane protein YckC
LADPVLHGDSPESSSDADPVPTSDSLAVPNHEAGEAHAWRDELSDRLNRYRARRKARPPRYPSLSLRFEAFDSASSTNATSRTFLPSTLDPVSDRALALDELRSASSAAPEIDLHSRPGPVAEPRPSVAAAPAQMRAGQVGAKIIEFPRFAWGPPAPPPDQLAEPVCDRPRILEVPEFEPPPPALGGITIDAVKQPEAEKRPGIDGPLQSAPLGLRMVAAMVDGIIIATASALFGFIFWKVTALEPPLTQMWGLVAGIPCVFWAAYQYLLVVYAASTPGLRVAGLQLARFDGAATTRSRRRWRVLACYLSALSLGMGYAWVFLDEDSLCWHDRITHTYLAPKNALRGH